MEYIRKQIQKRLRRQQSAWSLHGTFLLQSYNDPPSPLGIFSRLPVELRWQIYDFAFSDIHFYICPRPASFYADWARLPGIWHREPSYQTSPLCISKTFDRDVLHSIHPNTPIMSGTRRKHMSVRITSDGWSATHDPLQLDTKDITSLTLNILATPQDDDPGQIIWLRRNAQSFIAHWDAAQLRVAHLQVAFVDNTAIYAQWKSGAMMRAKFHHFYRVTMNMSMVETLLYPQLNMWTGRGWEPSGVALVLGVLHPLRGWGGAVKASVHTAAVVDWRVQESLEAFVSHKFSAASRSCRAAIDDAMIDWQLDSVVGPTADALREDRVRNVNIWEHRALDLEFGWAAALLQVLKNMCRMNWESSASTDNDEVARILSELSWDMNKLNKLANPKPEKSNELWDYDPHDLSRERLFLHKQRVAAKRRLNFLQEKSDIRAKEIIYLSKTQSGSRDAMKVARWLSMSTGNG